MDLDEFRAASLDQWSRSAEGWRHNAGRVDEWAEAATDWMLQAATPQPGDRVLELACGPAGVGLRAAPLVEPGGRVICSDFAESMLEVARERAREQGVSNVEFRMIDAERMDLPSGEVDVVLCRFGFMLMADPAAALHESRRVLRPAGRLALAAWSEAGRNPWASTPMGVVRSEIGVPPPEPDAPGMFALADRGRLRALMESAGFGDVETTPLPGTHRYDSFDAWWELTMELARPFRDAMGEMSEEGRRAVRERMRQESERYQRDGALEFPAEMVAGAGTAIG